ncbi:MAG: hypothetical protein DHS20C13_15650 [Thermodesulfobacteriota bacterium]|nr:MAG: hypothetical protein DHS20C13_15650 [Thermodesulfobacteriota bacterium]
MIAYAKYIVNCLVEYIWGDLFSISVGIQTVDDNIKRDYETYCPFNNFPVIIHMAIQ